MQLTLAQLKEIMPRVPEDKAELYAEAATRTAERFSINTPRRLAAWLGNIAYESDELNAWEEYGGGGGAFDLYYGRGPIQLTHRANYEAAGEYLDVDLLSSPDLVASDAQIGWDVAGWFWRYGNGDLNTYADDYNFWETYRRVLGGDNGSYTQRKVYYDRALAVLSAKEEDPAQGTDPDADYIGVDRLGWVKNLSTGRYLKGLPHHEYVTNKDGWLWTTPDTEPEPETPDVPFQIPFYNKAWPEANNPVGYIGDGSYVDLHPERYDWEPKVDWVVRRTIGEFYDEGVWGNTYVWHPPYDPPGVDENYERQSVDFWAWGGRGYSIGTGLGHRVFDFLYNLPGEPEIWWIIWNGRMWTYYNGWLPAPGGPPDSDPGHYGHIHVTYFSYL